jgi:hypothetical protein
MKARTMAVSVVCLLASISSALAQPRVDPRNMYERVVAIMPIVGKCTLEDPILPMYAPTPSEVRAGLRTGILGYTHVPSDDGKFALVEFVAKDKSAFKTILADLHCKVSQRS